MMKIDRLVLFGPPGTGKTTVAQALRVQGYKYFDGDAHSLPESVKLNKRGLPLTDDLRDREYRHIFDTYQGFVQDEPLAVFDYHLMFDRYRLDLRRRIPELRWIYLTANFEAVMSRLDRPDHLLSDTDFIKSIYNRFEEPSFPVQRVDATQSVEEVIKQVLSF